MKLGFQALLKGGSGILLLGALLFWPAGTLQYYKGWLLMGLLFIPMLIVGVVLLKKDRALLEKRLSSKESEKEQRLVILVSSVEFAACFLLAGFDFRFGWSSFPLWLTIAASVLFLAAYFIYVEVMRENAYLSRTVEVQENQKVVDTGLYGVVRHPMYFGTILLFWAMPLVLGSWPAFAVMLPYPLLLVKRIKNEEAVLETGLPGYTEYEKKVKYRLLPFIW